MLGQTAQQPEPAGKHARPTAGVNDPARKEFTVSAGLANCEAGRARFGDFHGDDFRRTPNVRPGFSRERKHVLIEHLAVDLIRWQTHLVKRSQLAATIKVIVGSSGEPEPQAILDDMVMAEVMRQRQAFGEEATAHLCGCLSHLAIKLL
jgi:hypothetical protein